jgi:hypothetical protein
MSINWQDISTAPKDGTWVLLRGGTTDEEEGHELNGFQYGASDVDRARPVVAKWNEYTESWVYDCWDGDWRSSYKNPTHWVWLKEVL